MTRWSEAVGDDTGDAYDARMAALARSGHHMHGEADLVSGLVASPARVLDAGCGTGRIGIELLRRGFDVVGVDADDSMLAVARRGAPDGTWVSGDLAALDPGDPRLGGPFAIILLAGNVVPLLAAGTEADVVRRLADCLEPGGLLVTGFGLDVAHLPLDHVPVTLDDYDGWCAEAKLTARARHGSWDPTPYIDGAGYAVSIHLLTQPQPPTLTPERLRQTPPLQPRPPPTAR